MKHLLAIALLSPVVAFAQPCFGPGPCPPDDSVCDGPGPCPTLQPPSRTFDYELDCKWDDGYELQVKVIPRGNQLFPLAPIDECEAYRATRN